MAKKIDLNGLDHFKDKENAMIADAYSSSKTYAVGDYVYYAGTLYVCTTAITTAEAWTAGHWTAAKLADDCSALKTAITQMEDVVVVSTEEPTSETNKIWINSNSSSVQVPTFEELLAAFPVGTATGELASFTDGANGIPIKSLVATIPYNANGVTGLTGKRMNKNLLASYQKPKQSYAPSTLNADIYTRLPINTKYRLMIKRGSASGSRKGFSFFETDGTLISASVPIALTAASTETAAYVSYYSTRWWQDGSDFTQTYYGLKFTRDAYMLPTISNDNAFVMALYDWDSTTADTPLVEPNTLVLKQNFTDGNNEPITVYGGTYDFISGVLTSTYDSDGTELETPVEYQMTPQNIPTLYGDNNIIIYGCTTTVKYYADVQKYIEKRIAG